LLKSAARSGTNFLRKLCHLSEFCLLFIAE
jgi:hypothetical protein